VGRRGRLELRRLRESRYDGMVVFIAGMVDGVGRFERGVRVWSCILFEEDR
jgi:hypothetical protein